MYSRSVNKFCVIVFFSFHVQQGLDTYTQIQLHLFVKSFFEIAYLFLLYQWSLRILTRLTLYSKTLTLKFQTNSEEFSTLPSE